MSDSASKYTDKKIKNLDQKIQTVYGDAYVDISHKLDDFTKKYQAKYAIHEQELKDGKITQEQLDSWVKGQIFQGKQWKAKKDQITHVIMNSNQVATSIINSSTADVFCKNANFMAYQMESGQGVNFGFDIYDKATVVKLIKDDPTILPEWKIDEPKDYAWNYKKVNHSVTQGIIQGESLDKITKRLANGLVSQNQNLMKTFARTAMTGAQNAGRDQRLMDAKGKGIKVVKEWMATLDGRTRDSHAHMDGERIKVGDKWHPMKFSNGCRFPGDPEGPPHEVYNCRCTMVGDIEGYPAEYQRYDNIDGKPIKNMTYADWYKAKYHKEFEYKPVTPAPTGIDYSKYGGKDVLDIIKKYNGDYEDFINHSTPEEFDTVWNATQFTIQESEEWFENAKKDPKVLKKQKTKTKAMTEEEKAQKAFEKAQKDLEDIEQDVKAKGADKVFKGIWKDDVTYADWEDKQNSVISKKKYYNEQIQIYKDDFAASVGPEVEDGEKVWKVLEKHHSKQSAYQDENVQKVLKSLGYNDSDWDDIWTLYESTKTKMLKPLDYLAQLDEFEKNGPAFSKLLADKRAAEQLVRDLRPKPKPGEVFGPEAYSKARKDAAVWAKSSDEADAVFRKATEEAWQKATKEQRYAAWDYTAGSGKFNRPTRGYDGSWYSSKGIGNVPLNREGAEKEIMALTELLENSTLQQDTWLQRGIESMSGLSNFVGVPENVLSGATQEELEQLLIGKRISDAGFMSCGSAKGKGFSGTILNIYCPKGSQALYCEPFSAFGRGGGKDWDGVSKQQYFGGELETLLQRVSDFEITKVEKRGYTIYIDIDLVGQDPHRYDHLYK